MISRIFKTLLILFVFCFPATNAQWVQPFPQGLGIELGGGHNQLLWHVNPHPPFSASDFPRQEPSFTPTARLSYDLNPLEGTELLPFVGYDQFGGKSGQDTSGYKDEYWIYAINAGIIVTYRFADFTVGPGFVYNRHIRKIIRSYGLFSQSSSSWSWVQNDETIFLKDFSYDLGLRLSWTFAHWSLSGEAWFGISSLEKNELNGFLDIRENHFRILAGYRL